MTPRTPSLLRWLHAEWPRFGPWTACAAELPPGGPSAMAEGTGAVALGYGAGRLEAERSGLHQSQHAMRPELLGADAQALLVPRFTEPLSRPEERLPVPVTVHDTAQRRRALLKELEPAINARKALVSVGLKRRHVDRWLDQEVRVLTRIGPTLGGVAAGFLRHGPSGPVALRWDRARADGWLALDLAALHESAAEVESARQRHREIVADPSEREAADEAFDLAWLVAALRELRMGNSQAAASVQELVRPRVTPSGPVRVWIEGPPFVADDLWQPPGSEVEPARARWLVSELDGLAVGGGALRVRCEPPVRAGRRSSPREPQLQRRRRLFSRWDEGIEHDDEGLVGATPEALAMRVAEGAEGTVLDGTCGIGALAIAHARQPGVSRVLAVDLSRERLAMARHNAEVYGVADRIEFVHADVFDVLRERAADRLVLDPPWGGRDYDRSGMALADLGLDVARAVSGFRGAVRLKLPRSLDVQTLPGTGWQHELVVDARGIIKMLWSARG